MKHGFSIMTCNIGDIVGGTPLDSDQVAAFIQDCGVPAPRDLMVRFFKKELMEESVRSRSVMELMAWLDKKNPDHVVLGGDFNTIPFSRTVRRLSPRSGRMF